MFSSNSRIVFLSIIINYENCSKSEYIDVFYQLKRRFSVYPYYFPFCTTNLFIRERCDKFSKMFLTILLYVVLDHRNTLFSSSSQHERESLFKSSEFFIAFAYKPFQLINIRKFYFLVTTNRREADETEYLPPRFYILSVEKQLLPLYFMSNPFLVVLKIAPTNLYVFRTFLPMK